MIRICLVFVLATVWQVFGTVDLRTTQEGEIAFDGGSLSVVCHRLGWGGLPHKIDYKSLESPVRRFWVVDGAAKLFEGRSSWTMQADGTVKGVVSLTCVAPTEAQCIALTADVPAVPVFGLGDGTAQEYELPIERGGSQSSATAEDAQERVPPRSLRLRFDAPIRYHAQDSRKWGKQWSVRFGGGRARFNDGHRAGVTLPGDTFSRCAYAVGDRVEWKVTISSPEGLSLKQFTPYVIKEGDEWIKFDHRNDIVPGSALDFSAQGLQDTPAGKHGWLKAKGGHLEFEELPGVEQRFYGVNLCFAANYLDHDLADRVVDRFVRCGYNTVRIHHHDGAWAKAWGARHDSGGSRSCATVGVVDARERVPPADDIDRLDYLIAKCIERGIYITTDLYVSRPVKWRDIGIDRDGEMNKQLYKTYVGIYEPAFTNWCEFAKAFLSHVNPYTGRSYADEPGMPFISLINEGRLGMGWAAKKDGGKILAAWHEFGGVGDLPNPWRKDSRDAHRAFDEWINAKIWAKCSAYVRSLGAKALLTNDNNGPRHGEGEGLTPRYDYVDNHFYVDHPSFIDEPWRLPSRCDNVNPIRTDKPKMFHAGWSKGSAKPYTITEWNFSGPGRYRGMGGILTGALAAEQEWDGLWRFAYSHSNQNLGDNPNRAPGYFDCVSDPIIAASDRASVFLYLRRDADSGGACLSRPDSGGSRLSRPDSGGSRSCATVGVADARERVPPALHLDRENGSMAIVTPRTCGGFAESGIINAGPLTFSICTNGVAQRIVPTTLWVSSLDGWPVEASTRLLLVHLTDVQGNGVRYADRLRRTLLSWGKGCLAEAGSAKVALRLDAPEGFVVHELDTAGNRIGKLPVSTSGGVLSFEVSTCGPHGCRIYYEIVRLEKLPKK